MKRTGLSQSKACRLAAVLLLSLGCGATAEAAQSVLDVDLSPLIDQSARYPTRFAVDVPHPVSTAEAGTWTQNGTRSTWTYSIRVPTATSMSFHAPAVTLPDGAVLTVTGQNGTSTSYRAHDVARSGLWSRPLPGDSLLLSLSVGSAQLPAVALRIESFQAGYRGLGSGVPDNAHYREIMKSAAAQLSSCAVNYSCQATSANQGPAHATVAIVIANTGLCTGTLLNDTSSDSTPFVLTARHCESGAPGGGDPTAAANVTVYWDAVAPCGAVLGSIYDGNSVTQTGATTIVEQQDAWLIKLDAPPAASDAYYAGWDATGGIFSGGYSIHHALGYRKQYVGWYGQPVLINIPGAALKVGYDSTFWGVVNQVGNVGAGASGGALFDPDNNAVGSATLAWLTNGPDTDGVCPVTPPQAPSPSTVTAEYTAWSAIWSSTADTTSTTGAATLRSALDAAGTGKLVNSGTGLLPVTLAIDQSYPSTGQTVNLTWSAPGAQTCTASGGVNGDGWAGARTASGTYALTEQSGSQVTYSIRCTASNQVGSASVSATWQFVPAVVNMTGPTVPVDAGSLAVLQWAANTQPCTATGGISGDGWAGAKASSGSQSVLVSVLGNTTYTLTCGSGVRTATGQYSITVVAPYVSQIISDADQMRVGQLVDLQLGAGGSCIASGGAPGDGWAGPLGTQTPGLGGSGYAVTETTAGTYTYTVTCSGVGPTANLSATSSITLTFTNAAPIATLSATPTPVEVYTDPGATTSVLNLAWTSNVRPCGITYAGPGNIQGTLSGIDLAAGSPSGTGGDDQQVAGAYVYTLTCGTGANQTQTTAPVTWFTNAPAVSLNAASTWPQGTPTPLAWHSNVYPCTGTGGATGDGWTGAKAGAIGAQTLTESTLGTVTFSITCGAGAQTVQAQVSTSVTTPTASITASATTLPLNSPLVINWTANFAPCTSSISPGSSGGWGTVLPMTGGFQTSELVAGTYTYTINCAGAQASVQVTFTGSLTTLTANASSAPVDMPVTLSWSSPTGIGTTSCTPSGGSAGDGWTGSLAGSGTKTVTSATASTVTYSITCDFGYGPSQAQTQVTYTPVSTGEPTVPTPVAALTASLSSQVVGSSVTLTWTSQNASACTTSGGASGDGWSGALLSLSGTMSVTESQTGSYSYGITCTGAPPAASAQAVVDFTNPPVTITGKSGGGGAVDLSCLLVLALVVYARQRRLGLVVIVRRYTVKSSA